ncbi:hypothetical protein ETB97_003890 [Aspergillus alliaceus]|uniref:Uncharacterized protein n=1 Tax=Petromyces alliaceus TaxID=209559 RepID=A0A8H6E555_PETAA|nr:hypothetical protein ETB97_003890 [Aspergillus burnettii]
MGIYLGYCGPRTKAMLTLGWRPSIANNFVIKNILPAWNSHAGRRIGYNGQDPSRYVKANTDGYCGRGEPKSMPQTPHRASNWKNKVLTASSKGSSPLSHTLVRERGTGGVDIRGNGRMPRKSPLAL